MPGWHPHPDAWLLIIVLGVSYALAIRRLGPRHVSPGEPPASRGEITAFVFGLAALWLAADWPVHDLAEDRLFTVHMAQHLLLTLVGPALLLMGTPGWLLRTILRPPWLMATVRRFSRPVLALLVFNGVLAFTHWPAIVDVTLRSEIAHFSVHAVLVVTALLMWMPVLSPIMEIPRLPYPGQMLYVFAQSIVPTVPAAFLTFGSEPLYRFYETVPRMWGISALTDMQMAGLTMKIVGGLILWTVIAVLFFKWSFQEEKGIDPMGWRDVERELDKTELPR